MKIVLTLEQLDSIKVSECFGCGVRSVLDVVARRRLIAGRTKSTTDIELTLADVEDLPQFWEAIRASERQRLADEARAIADKLKASMDPMNQKITRGVQREEQRWRAVAKWLESHE